MRTRLVPAAALTFACGLLLTSAPAHAAPRPLPLAGRVAMPSGRPMPSAPLAADPWGDSVTAIESWRQHVRAQAMESGERLRKELTRTATRRRDLLVYQLRKAAVEGARDLGATETAQLGGGAWNLYGAR